MTKHKPTLGTISYGTLRSEDLLAAFTAELEWIGDESDKGLIRDANFLLSVDESARDDNWHETATDTVNELQDALDAHAPAYCYFGNTDGDGADFGFWPSWDSIDELEKFNDLSEVPEDIADDFVVVNDHGNVSIYGADRSLIWDCV